MIFLDEMDARCLRDEVMSLVPPFLMEIYESATTRQRSRKQAHILFDRLTGSEERGNIIAASLKIQAAIRQRGTRGSATYTIQDPIIGAETVPLEAWQTIAWEGSWPLMRHPFTMHPTDALWAVEAMVDLRISVQDSLETEGLFDSLASSLSPSIPETRKAVCHLVSRFHDGYDGYIETAQLLLKTVHFYGIDEPDPRKQARLALERASTELMQRENERLEYHRIRDHHFSQAESPYPRSLWEFWKRRVREGDLRHFRHRNLWVDGASGGMFAYDDLAERLGYEVALRAAADAKAICDDDLLQAERIADEIERFVFTLGVIGPYIYVGERAKKAAVALRDLINFAKRQ